MKKKMIIIIGIFLVLLITVLFVFISKRSALYPFEQNGQWGYMDKSGNIIIKPKFAEARDFTSKYAPVKSLDTNLWGYINKKGNYIISPQYEFACQFIKGYAVVYENGTHRDYLIDTDGNEVNRQKAIQLRAGYRYTLFPWSEEIYDGPRTFMGVGKEYRWLYGYVDKNGKEIIPPKFEIATEIFSEGLAAVGERGPKNSSPEIRDTYGYTNLKGELVIGYQFKDIRSFSDGLAAVGVLEDGKLRYYYINKKGKKVITLPKECEELSDFHLGLARIKINGEYQYINKKGQFIYPHD